jgi:hypothetical protein
MLIFSVIEMHDSPVKIAKYYYRKYSLTIIIIIELGNLVLKEYAVYVQMVTLCCVMIWLSFLWQY